MGVSIELIMISNPAAEALLVCGILTVYGNPGVQLFRCAVLVCQDACIGQLIHTLLLKGYQKVS